MHMHTSPAHVHACANPSTTHSLISVPLSSLLLPCAFIHITAFVMPPSHSGLVSSSSRPQKWRGLLAPAPPHSSLQGLHVGVPLARFGLLVREIQGFKVRGSLFLLEVDGGV